MDKVEVVEDRLMVLWMWQCEKCLEINKTFIDPFRTGYVECKDCQEKFKPVEAGE